MTKPALIVAAAIAVVIASPMVPALDGPAWAQKGFSPTSCKDAVAYCLQPQRGACGASCVSYCNAEGRTCRKTGTFKTRNHSWTGLAKH
ncbi:MAG: hypothetical protein GC182_11560 [Rhodopseudomonas sp.]|nr:hypothetical protein [Rhodopseudomonas sp.]